MSSLLALALAAATTTSTDPLPPPDATPAPPVPSSDRLDLEADREAEPFEPIPTGRHHRFRGTGMFIGAGAMNGMALGLTIAAAVEEDCSEYCFDEFFLGHGSLYNLAALPLTILGGRQRALHDASKRIPIPRGRARALKIAGATLLGLGVVGSAAANAVFWVRSPCYDFDPDDFNSNDIDRCEQRFLQLTAFPAYVAESAALAGAGMLSYGFTREIHAEVSIAPTANKQGGGLVISGRF